MADAGWLLTWYNVSEMVIIDILERAATDNGFLALLASDGELALSGYDLSPEARAALLAGDIRWIEAHVGGKLDARLRIWLDCRLQQEKW